MRLWRKRRCPSEPGFFAGGSHQHAAAVAAADFLVGTTVRATSAAGTDDDRRDGDDQPEADEHAADGDPDLGAGRQAALVTRRSWERRAAGRGRRRGRRNRRGRHGEHGAVRRAEAGRRDRGAQRGARQRGGEVAVRQRDARRRLVRERADERDRLGDRAERDAQADVAGEDVDRHQGLVRVRGQVVGGEQQVLRATHAQRGALVVDAAGARADRAVVGRDPERRAGDEVHARDVGAELACGANADSRRVLLLALLAADLLHSGRAARLVLRGCGLEARLEPEGNDGDLLLARRLQRQLASAVDDVHGRREVAARERDHRRLPDREVGAGHEIVVKAQHGSLAARQRVHVAARDGKRVVALRDNVLAHLHPMPALGHERARADGDGVVAAAGDDARRNTRAERGEGERRGDEALRLEVEQRGRGRRRDQRAGGRLIGDGDRERLADVGPPVGDAVRGDVVRV
mmetsp:Transcript_37459/g.115700  ORF Transcript_37459/g.115700 Transcript_37459/m.115700 type:complete len:462 (-) Transcript_37459:2108-3493(-)